MNAIQIIRQHIELPQLLVQAAAPLRLAPRSFSGPLSSREIKPLIRLSYQPAGHQRLNRIKGV